MFNITYTFLLTMIDNQTKVWQTNIDNYRTNKMLKFQVLYYSTIDILCINSNVHKWRLRDEGYNQPLGLNSLM